MIIAGLIAIALTIAVIVVVAKRRVVKDDVAGQALVLSITADPDGWKRMNNQKGWWHKDLGEFRVHYYQGKVEYFWFSGVFISLKCGAKALDLLHQYEDLKYIESHNEISKKLMDKSIKLARNKLNDAKE